MLIKFLKNRYIKSKPKVNPAELNPFTEYSHRLGPPASYSTRATFDRIEPPSPSPGSTLNHFKHAVQSLFSESRLRWIQIIKDLLTIAVALITVLKFIWPAIIWLWTWIFA